MNWTDFCTETAKQSGLLVLLRVANRQLFENRLEKIHKAFKQIKILHQLFRFFFLFQTKFSRTNWDLTILFFLTSVKTFSPVWTLRLQSRRRWWRSALIQRLQFVKMFSWMYFFFSVLCWGPVSAHPAATHSPSSGPFSLLLTCCFRGGAETPFAGCNHHLSPVQSPTAEKETEKKEKTT